MRKTRRPGFSLYDLLVVIAILAVLAGLLLPAVQRTRSASERITSANNMRQIGIAMHNYHATNNTFPAGNDRNNFSALAHIAEYIEEQPPNFKKPLTDEANAQARKRTCKVFVSPRDPQPVPQDGFGPTNYLPVAGSRPALLGNDGVCPQDKRVTLNQIANGDGTSNTLMAIETLRGDGGNQAMTVQRQHVRLPAGEVGKLTDESGVKDFRDGKNIAGDRGGSWMDGRFLQASFTGTRLPNDPRPDVDCGGAGGLSAIRCLGPVVVLYCDASVRTLNPKIDLKTMKGLCSINGGEAVSGDP